MNRQSSARMDGREIALLVVIGAVLLLPSLATRDLWNPDEPRYYEVAREMIARGEYLVPHLDGAVYTEKPPLFFWMAAGIDRLGGGFNSGRVLAALAGMGIALLTYFFGLRLWPRPAPLLAGLTTLTTIFFLAQAKVGVIDPVLGFFATAAIMSGFSALHNVGRAAFARWLLCYGLIGLGALTKGHVGFIVPALVILAYAVIARREISAGGWSHLAGAVLMLIVVGAWLIPATVVAGTDYTYTLTWKQLANRAVDSYSHRRPFFYYLLVFPPMALPWLGAFTLAVIGAIAMWKAQLSRKALFPLIWFATIFIIFSAFSGKRPGYLMPLTAAFGLIIGNYLASGLRDGWRYPRAHELVNRLTLGFLGAALLVAAAAMAVIVWFPNLRNADFWPLSQLRDYRSAMAEAARLATVFQLAVGIGGMALVGAAAVVCAFLARGKTRLTIHALLATMVLLSLIGDLAMMSVFNPFKSGRFFCERAEPYLQAAGDEVYLLNNNLSGVYNLYTGRLSMGVIETPEELSAVLGQSRRAAIIGFDKNFNSMFAKGDISPTTYWMATRQRVGSRQTVLVTNWNPADTPGAMMRQEGAP